MKHTLPNLPYSAEDLSPAISAKTIEFHHGKHHQAYVNNLNNLIVGTKFENADLETIIKEADGGIFNNGAQVWNHTFYFFAFSPKPQKAPTGKLLDLINAQFGSFEQFKEKFTSAAASLFGSGWAWLVVNKEGKLEITQESNAGNPIRKGLRPLLTCDVWEHAYYLDYQNRRPDYLKGFWDIIDWKVIEERLK
ncbi:MAG TPA: superoxide dismutase [Tenuifilaceae bacterium]|nr:superoxide dismutase [Tenuifilaceae bacterium]